MNVSGSTAGNLLANVTVGGVTSSTVQVATVTPTVTSSNNQVPANAPTVTIKGYGFDPYGTNSVSFTNGSSTWTGTITAVTPNSLTVSTAGSGSPLTSGPLTAVVTTDGASNAAPVEVAVLTPVVTSSITNLGANATSLTITGYGFSSTVAQNTVSLSAGGGTVNVTGVTIASPESMTLAFTTDPTTMGALTATVTSNGVPGTATQVGTVVPVLTQIAGYTILASAPSVTISGAGFDTTAANDVLSLNDGAVGTITAVNGTPPTSLTFTFTSGFVPTAGSIKGSIVVDGVSSTGGLVTIAGVTPIVTSSTTARAANITSITIAGSGFDPTIANDSVSFTSGTSTFTGSVTAATPTSLTVAFGSGNNLTAGPLTALVTVNSTSAASVQVATVVPVVTASYATQAVGLALGTVNIFGAGIDPLVANDSIVFNDGATTNTAHTTYSTTGGAHLIVTFTTNPSIAGSLTAVVTADGLSSGAAVQVATITPSVTAEATTLNVNNPNASTLKISGYGFDPTASNNSVAFSYSGGPTGAVQTATGIVTGYTTGAPGYITVTFSGYPTAGTLNTIVTTDGASVAGVPVTVSPIVTAATVPLPNNVASGATSVTINGYGFDTNKANDSVLLTNSGGPLSVTSITSATATSLTVSFTGKLALGSLNAQVTSDLNQTAATAAATVVPAITSSTTALTAGATSISGIVAAGLSATLNNNALTLTDADGNVVSSVPCHPTLNGSAMTATFASTPVAGKLTASVAVTSGSVYTSSTVQVATVVPVVTASTATLADNASTLYIFGSSFDPTPGNNTVTFNDGAVGTVIGANPTSLQVQFTTPPTTAGSLTASVTTNGVSSGTALQVATVIPVVTSSTATLDVGGTTTLVINGYGFDPNNTKDTVALTNNATGSTDGVGTVAAGGATPTSLTVTFSGTGLSKPNRRAA